MSNAVFPALPGLAWSSSKTPAWKTKAQQAVSGKEIRTAYYSRPIWNFTLTYELLRGASGFSEFQQLAAFFNQRMGAFDDFLLSDPSDNTAIGQVIGTGDGTAKTFPLLHGIGGWLEPIGYAPAPTPYVNGVMQYSVARTNYVRNSSGTGAVVGTPGTLPANWSWSLSAGLTSSVVGTGTESGIAYVDVRISGTPSGGSSGLRFEALAIAASAGQTWTSSFFVRRVAGSNAGITLLAANERGYSSGSLPTTDDSTGGDVTANLGVADISQNRPVVSRTLSDANTASLRPQMFISHTVGVAMDITLRIGVPQTEMGAVATSPIPTTVTAKTVTDFTTDGLSVTFAAAPPIGATVTWSGTFYYRVRFKQDSMEFEQFMQDFWTLKKCELVGVI